ncbi:DUF4142 domain-containing protein [Hyphomicrobium sp.]|uniref:DUF4142 domain-containing protein n=1 Tax=Hyphomicrobium sp. TaxID=82 RepID=UPI002D77849E|nr:DUF4142 domain-containing protein [Hyphomicrobium sp.]HET6389542.1 DUF4142 domain-containing protein [Hyphomicrobium sp.]
MSKKSVNVLAFAALAAMVLPSASSFADDKSFLEEAIKGDNSEIALGRLAEAKGGNEAVKHFGRQLVKDHMKAKKQAMAVAKTMNVPDTETLSDDGKEEETKLDSLTRQDFDKEFAAYMVKDHQEDIQKFEEQAKGSGKVAELAKETLPTLRKHLKMAEELQKKAS